MNRNLNELQENINYHFSDEKLLITALTHSSYASEKRKSHIYNNERLEFIGDAFLDAIIGSKLYYIMLDSAEGALSQNRAEVVCEDTLADVARRIDLGKFLLLGKGEIMTNGADKSSILADALEALIGAIILDSDYETGKEVVNTLFTDKVRLAVLGKLKTDFKSKLQEKYQCTYHSNDLEYCLVKEDGPPHDRTFYVTVKHRGVVIGNGVGKSKAKAEQSAAESVLTKGEI